MAWSIVGIQGFTAQCHQGNVVWAGVWSRSRINLQTGRVEYQHALSGVEYKDAMMDNMDNVAESRFEALREIEKEKLKVAKAYNKKVWEKSFQVNDLVWKTILPLRLRNNRFGKWSPS
jgi:hypothetical protein